MRYDWDRIEHEYVTGKATYAELEQKYKIPRSTFEKRAKVRKFAEKRGEYEEKVRQKRLARAQARDSRIFANLGGALDKAARLLNKYVNDDDTIHGKIVNHMDGRIEEIRTKKLDTKALRDMTAAMREVSAAIKLLQPETDRGDEKQEGIIILSEVSEE